MRVSELAEDLEITAEAVLEQCRRLGVEASGADDPLRATDVVVLRSELADPAGETVASAPVASASPVPAVSSPSAVSPSAVGSMPGLAEELMAASTAAPAAPAAPAAGSRPPAFTGGTAPEGVAPGGWAGVPSVADDLGVDGHRSSPTGRRFDAAIRPGIVALLLAAVAFVGAEQIDDVPALVVALWIVGLAGLVIAVLAGNRARYRITTHPDQRSGLPVAVIVLVVAMLGLAGFGTAVWTVTRTAPAADAPLGLGDLRSVRDVRWGFQRVRAVAAAGWERPAKDADTCWSAAEPGRDDPRRDERVEVGGTRVDCDEPHPFEVVSVFAVDRDADSVYPADIDSTDRCDRIRSSLGDAAAGVTWMVEYPTEAGWERGDHDVACVAAALRDEPLG